MPELAQQNSEFWRPDLENRSTAPVAIVPDRRTCAECNTEYVSGSRFCYVCGTERYPQGAQVNASRKTATWRELRVLGLSLPSLVAFSVGVCFLVAAVVTGLIYTASTVLDWQAVQVWRMQWLLAASAAFLAGILLKRNADGS
jgi:hypothetical protein